MIASKKIRRRLLLVHLVSLHQLLSVLFALFRCYALLCYYALLLRPIRFGGRNAELTLRLNRGRPCTPSSVVGGFS
ncbi:hypothetical protein K470DRAFT_257124 [Piedraia hortae CBS 480.64]|uniref:Uncharacterized protein n=1 Tax=Piedraia hortae CBS 480.64 TaxID=1314780 RepID=A0A6A7C132_9PEZI|nr:hypothetical protein K470DRAFT_257124 [Piedraia hortae CBS 480.64]